MNNVFCLLAIFAVSYHMPPATTHAIKHDDGVRIFENEVNQTLECVRRILQEGIPEHGLPSFNPLEIAKLDLDFDNFGQASSGHLNFSNLIIDGITGWQLTDAEIALGVEGGLALNVQALLNIPTLKIRTDYLANVSVIGFQVWGDGDINLQSGNLGVKLDTKLLLIPRNLERIKILFSLKDFNIKFTGFFGSEEQSELASKVLNDLMVDYVNGKSQDISDVLEEIIKNLVNKTGRDGKSIIEIIMEICLNEAEEF